MRDILIVEDGLHERERLERLFSTHGFSVSSAESAAEAERLLAADRFRLVVLDIGLSDKSGSYLFDNIRRQPQSPFVLVLTGNPSIHLKQRFLDEGAAGFIVKASPAAENSNLLATVQQLLGASTAAKRTGIALSEFIKLYLSPVSRDLFLGQGGQMLGCRCGGADFLVVFDHRPQLPPVVEGRVICARCGEELDPRVE